MKTKEMEGEKRDKERSRRHDCSERKKKEMIET